MAAARALPSLFKPLTIGSVPVANRFIMAPLTRCRAKNPGHVPTPLMAEYYGQRASAGLIITECTMIQDGHSSYLTEPGVFSAEQVAAWKTVTSNVHSKGGKIFCQLWHGGRACLKVNGVEPVAPSAIPIARTVIGLHNATGKEVPYDTPRALTDAEIPAIIDTFASAAKNAIAAGFDGVELHGANGYLLDQFWRASSNHRTGPYGGSVENRTKFMVEVAAAVSKAVGSGRVGMRISPVNSYMDMIDPEPEKLVRHLGSELSKLDVAYLHIMRADFFGQQKGNTVQWVRESFKGSVIANMGYEIEEAESAIASGQIDAVAFGTKFLANPDLPARAKAGAALQPPNPATFYTQGPAGYTDYPTMA